MSEMTAQLLLVEDDETIAFGLVHALQRDGHNVVHFDNGEDAIDALDRGLPDIAILDLVLLVAGGMDHRIAEAGGITGRKKLFGIGRAALAAKAAGHREPEVEKPIGAFCRTVATADGVNRG